MPSTAPATNGRGLTRAIGEGAAMRRLDARRALSARGTRPAPATRPSSTAALSPGPSSSTRSRPRRPAQLRPLDAHEPVEQRRGTRAAPAHAAQLGPLDLDHPGHDRPAIVCPLDARRAAPAIGERTAREAIEHGRVSPSLSSTRPSSGRSMSWTAAPREPNTTPSASPGSSGQGSTSVWDELLLSLLEIAAALAPLLPPAANVANHPHQPSHQPDQVEHCSQPDFSPGVDMIVFIE
jgi:hypothetical protein